MSSSYLSKQVIVVRHDLKMRKGKIAAQAGHACVEATLRALLKMGLQDKLVGPPAQPELPRVMIDTQTVWSNSPLIDWFNEGTAKICVYVKSEEELLALAQKGRERGFEVALIRDAGHTEFGGVPTYTCLAFEPLHPEEIDPLTGNLPLY